jgi:hypothetical protein
MDAAKVLLPMLLAVLLFGCVGPNNSKPEMHNVLEGAIAPSGAMPQETANVSYLSKGGESLAAESAYPGFVYIFTKNATLAAVNASIMAKGGSIASAIPRAGIYLIRVETGKEAGFLSAMYGEQWFIDGIPASAPAPSIVSLYDLFSYAQDPTDCSAQHGDLTKLIAGRLTQNTEETDVHGAQWISIAHDIGQRMATAKAANENVVFSLSLQSAESAAAASGDKTGCSSAQCSSIRHAQMDVLRMFLQLFDQQIKDDPASAERAILVISAGNAGVDMDSELGQLQNDYKDAFKHVKIVGGSNPDGEIEKGFNHAGDSSLPIVYAPSDNVNIYNPTTSTMTECSGTSFAAPEVSAALDYIWSANPALNASQVTDAFDKALAEMGKNKVIPTSFEQTSMGFLSRAMELASPGSAVNTGTQAFPNFTYPFSPFPYGIVPSWATTEELYQQNMSSNGISGGSPPYHFAIQPGSGSLPDGLTMSSDGIISGTPTTAGTSAFTVCAYDSAGASACGQTSIQVDQRCGDRAPYAPYDGRWNGVVTEKGKYHMINDPSFPYTYTPYSISYTFLIDVECGTVKWAQTAHPFFDCASGCNASGQLQPPPPGTTKNAGDVGYWDLSIDTPNGGIIQGGVVSASLTTITLGNIAPGYKLDQQEIYASRIQIYTCPGCDYPEDTTGSIVLTKIS